MEKIRVCITNDGAKGFLREHARKLDRGESLPPEITISFESAAEMEGPIPGTDSSSVRCQATTRIGFEVGERLKSRQTGGQP